jgi:uncharacterized membrane protein YedE/YeeE
MNRTPLALAAALVSGTVFGAGLALARMIDPDKVKDFLDIAAIPSGGWDPSLALVMGGGALVFFIGFRLHRLIRKPLAAPIFSFPDKTKIDLPLIAGSVLFGVGWGAVGLCPGPAIADLALSPAGALLFVGAMFAGSWLAGALRNASLSRPVVASADTPRA